MTIYPDYNLIRGKYSIYLETLVRKQDENGVWFLVPVRGQYYLNKKIGPKNRLEGLLTVLKMFNETCYRTKLFWKINPGLINPERPWKLIEEKDEDQRSEEERLLINNYLI